ncbi:hypothetical protein GS597_10845 [Synechococcales cyanobacterium C]|uniref:Uncharacterized protein n=1 Tax=Petrachloros mirabilis ULC683 TaxID=2781853 RepID=A0A8K2A7K2_9CYAN|nr:hypothetical protein [Petrachloros mirabilis]NCJ06996.1 hypothetical protein [Petrachloros mirabilis ULC683]
MRCAVISQAGQIIARGRLILHRGEGDELRLDLQTDGGRLIQGGLIGEDGDMAEASQALFRQFFQVWGFSNMTLKITIS